MADISIISRLISGLNRNVDLSSNTIVVGNVKVGGATNYLTFNVASVTDAKTITMPNANVDLGDISTNAGAISDHLSDSEDAHDASAISVLDTAENFTGSTVEAVLAELSDAIGAGSDDQTAAEVVYTQATPSDWTVADDSSVKATLDEVGSRLIINEGAISALSTGITFREYCIAITGDAAPADDTDLATLVPFSDDDTPTQISSFAEGDYILFDCDGTPKLMIVDGSNQVTSVGVTQPVEGNCYHVKYNFPAGADALEKRAIYGKSATVMVKIADEVWDSAVGIQLGSWTSGAGSISSADSVLSAIQKLDGNIAAINDTDDQTAAEVVYTQATPSDWTVADDSSVKATLDEVGSRLIAAEDHASSTSNPHSVDSSDIFPSGIVNSDIASDAAITTSKLADATVLAESVTFFTSTDISASEAETLSDGSNADSLHIHAKIVESMVAGEAFAANSSFFVRMALNGETAGRIYKADMNAGAAGSETNTIYVIGLAQNTTSSEIAAGASIPVVKLGEITLQSSDTAFGVTEIGLPVYLSDAGAFDINSQITFETNDAEVIVAIVKETGKMEIKQAQIMGIN